MSADQKYRVIFQPSGRSVQAQHGCTILEVAIKAGINLQTPCGGHGTCGKCLVRIHSGETDAAPSSSRLDADMLTEGWRLACKTIITSNLTIEVPDSSVMEQTLQILTTSIVEDDKFAPEINVCPVSIPPPTMEDNRADLQRLSDVLHKELTMVPSLYATLPRKLRNENWAVRLVERNSNVIDVLPMKGDHNVMGVAFDLGTTTVVGTLIDLIDGSECGVAATLNKQVTLGDDVLSRILHVREHQNGLKELQSRAVSCLNDIISLLCKRAKIDSTNIFAATVAGNTTMQQLLAGIDPSPLGELPFTPAFTAGLEVPAQAIGLQINNGANVFLMPQVGGFVGGDTVAAMLATNFDNLQRPTLLVDIGTNGEIALFTGKEIICTSTAAGPAFEGARIKQGMRATTGAIEKIVIENGDVQCSVIGKIKPTGLCGTALIDGVAEMLRHGILDDTGRINLPDELPATLPLTLKQRVLSDGNDGSFVLAADNDGSPIVSLYQRDIRELQLAAGAIRAGITILLQKAGLDASELDAILLAGGFGNYIRCNNAQRIGLLPPVSEERIRFVGNAAATGAKMVLRSGHARERGEIICRNARHIDLGMDVNFQMEFAQAMLFPI